MPIPQLTEKPVAKNSGPPRRPIYTATHTDVLGFTNTNAWPVKISISNLRKEFMLSTGQSPTDELGRKYNDPILEQYVGAMMLTREWASKPIEIVRIAHQETVPPISSTGFVGMQVRKDPTARPTEEKPRVPIQPAKIQTRPSEQTNPVKSFSFEDAKKRGLIRPTSRPNETAQEDAGGVPLPANQLEEIDYARDMTPGAMKRANRDVADPHAVVPHVIEALVNGPLKVDESFQPDSTNFVQDALRAVVNKFKKQPEPVPEVVAPAPVESALPEPDLEEAAPVHVAATPGDQKGFICLVDGKGFDYRSKLANYAKRKYPDRFDEIMANYPPSAQEQAPQPQPSVQ